MHLQFLISKGQNVPALGTTKDRLFTARRRFCLFEQDSAF